jgi:hypothetical protein
MTTETFTYRKTAVTFNYEYRVNRTAKGYVTCVDDEHTGVADFVVAHTGNEVGSCEERYVCTYVVNGKSRTFKAMVWDEILTELTFAAYHA